METTHTSSLPMNKEIAMAREDYFSDFACHRIIAVMEHPNYDGSLDWISENTGISLDDVYRTLKNLTLLQMVVKSDRGYRLTKQDFIASDENIKLDELIEGFKDVSRQILNDFSEDNHKIGDLQILLSNEESVKEFKASLRQALDKLIESSKAKPIDGLYNISLTATYQNLDGVKK